jgi:hypothetical protein
LDNAVEDVMGDGTSWLTEQWFQRMLNALKETLDVSEELKSEMIEFLFEAGFWDRAKLTFPAAVARFNACLNPGKRGEFFKAAEILALMKRFGRHQFFIEQAEFLGYRVERIATDELRIREISRLADALERHNALNARVAHDVEEARALLHQLDTIGGKTRIHPAFREGSGSFDLPGDGEAAAALVRSFEAARALPTF